MVTLVRPDDPSVQVVLAALAVEYRARYGTLLERENGVYADEEFMPPRGAFMVVQRGGTTVAGGALRWLADGVGEIKRMWTAPEARGRGYGRRVLSALEAMAREYGYGAVRLETATPQAAAIELYRSAGYEPTEAYGMFRDDPRFVYFEKRLS